MGSEKGKHCTTNVANGGGLTLSEISNSKCIKLTYEWVIYAIQIKRVERYRDRLYLLYYNNN